MIQKILNQPKAKELFSMIVVMKRGADRVQVDHMVERVEAMGLKSHVIYGTERTVIAAVGEKRDEMREALESTIFQAISKILSFVTTP